MLINRSLLLSRLPLILLLCCTAVFPPFLLAQNAIRVEVAVAEERNLINEIPLTGSVTSPRVALLSTEVAGLISNMHVDAGDTVEAGDVLLELDREMSEIAVERAQASADRARETWTDSQRRLREAETLAERENIAASDVRALEARVRIDEADFRAAEAELRERQAELNRHRIVAPFKGSVSRKLAEVGEWLSPGTEVVEVVATDELRLDFQVPQRFYPEVDETTQLAVRFDAHPERVFTGRVHRKVPLSSDDGRSFLLRALLDDGAAPALIPGMSADATLKLAVDRRGVTVPRDALMRYPDGRVSVWTVGERNAETHTAEVHEQQVSTGLGFADQVEIRSGLDAGETVVTRGNEALRDGQTVQVTTTGGE